MDLVFDRVGKRFDQRDALIDLSFSMASGEMAFLTGHSGAGKSTLLRLLLLLDRASSGEVSVNGRPLSKIRESGIAAYRRDFGVVFQDHKLLDRERASPEMLSGGEQQRVGIARAVVARPKILIADEPTGNLDPQLSAEIMGLFAAFNSVGVTVIVASHDLALISRMSQRILTLKEGRLITLNNDLRGDS